MALPDKNIRILVVDDAPMIRRILKNLLKEMGFSNIDEAEDGMVALQKLRNQKYDFVITDWNMPNLTGIELVQEIRKDPNLKSLPIMMVTAEAKKENIILALKSGVNNYIVKPFTPENVKAKIEAIFSAKKK
ncbi:two-component system, chemotaxis family, chemotaxis protein CheY [Nitratiruptor sp. YY08-26]|uniref:chemotaxis response regulator CheY n=1 Tax=unclassified Nitratiruptor TaxID=2624044 RepID=UPI0019165134|nr:MULTISPECIES: chemotaxis response regulator CheY [unclassified Nitratiruptor]BCD61840.1 two-component system, chemotaxis family, chemotaxis protein CheY [Nitratiruptor sp. YY08-13]BCD65775.1 two-component system, chemotaxis family, chemotaxis protein CheY [Nitratiruptor sp. YY08-26]